MTFTRPRTGALAGRLVVAAVVLGAVASTAGGADTHGALPMAAQQQRLDALLPPLEQQLQPAMVDPVIWNAIVPQDNQMTPERIALGRKLYFDTRLSADGTVACATCHDVSRGFTDQRPVSEGIKDHSSGGATRRRL